MPESKFIKFEIVTPERVVLKEEILQITVPTKMGEITVLPDHIPLVSSLLPGVVHVKKKDGQDEIMSISGGFLEVLKDKVVILADTAERAEELDLDRAEEAHCEQHQVGPQLEFAARDLDHLALLPLEARRDQFFHLAICALETLGRHGPVARAAFLVRT